INLRASSFNLFHLFRRRLHFPAHWAAFLSQSFLVAFGVVSLFGAILCRRVVFGSSPTDLLLCVAPDVCFTFGGADILATGRDHYFVGDTAFGTFVHQFHYWWECRVIGNSFDAAAWFAVKSQRSDRKNPVKYRS